MYLVHTIFVKMFIVLVTAENNLLLFNLQGLLFSLKVVRTFLFLIFKPNKTWSSPGPRLLVTYLINTLYEKVY